VFALLQGIKKPKPAHRDQPLAHTQGLQLSAIKVQQSVTLWRMQIAIHLLILFCLCWGLGPLMPGLWQMILMWITLCLLLAFHFYYLWHLHRQETGFLWVSDSDWHWQDKNGHCDLVLAGSITIWPSLIILPFRECTHGRRKTLILLSDSATAEDLRRLRTWLRTSLNQ
jgi:hypothetical protein